MHAYITCIQIFFRYLNQSTRPVQKTKQRDKQKAEKTQKHRRKRNTKRTTQNGRSQHSQKCKILARTVFVPCDLDLWPFDRKLNAFPGLMVEVEYFRVKFGAAVLGISCGKQTDRQTDRQKQTPLKIPPQRLRLLWNVDTYTISTKYKDRNRRSQLLTWANKQCWKLQFAEAVIAAGKSKDWHSDERCLMVAGDSEMRLIL